jgi:hypothetical protein
MVILYTAFQKSTQYVATQFKDWKTNILLQYCSVLQCLLIMIGLDKQKGNGFRLLEGILVLQYELLREQWSSFRQSSHIASLVSRVAKA